MAQSPTEAGTPDDDQSYRSGWKATFRLIKEGKSWSGREANCVFLNLGGGRFGDVSGVSGFDFIDDARAIATVDWDHDGSLDFWVANRSAPKARFMRNTTRSGSFLSLRLQGTSCNRDGIGARVEVELGDGSIRRLIRTLHAGEAYMSQSSKWIHFGLGDAKEVTRVVVRWPGGPVEEFAGVAANGRFRLVQGTGLAEPWSPPRSDELALAPAELEVPAPTGKARVVLADRVPAPPLRFLRPDGGEGELLDGVPVLINLWASWCAPCVAELTDFREHADELSTRGLRVLALSVDEDEKRPEARRLLSGLDWPFESGYAPAELLDTLDTIQRTLLLRKRRLPLPTSFLVDAQGRIAVIYKGPVESKTLLEDLALLPLSGEELRDRAVPFPARWITDEGTPPDLLPGIVRELFDRGLTEPAGACFLLMPRPAEADPAVVRDYLSSCLQLAQELSKSEKPRLAADLYGRALEIDPDAFPSRMGRAQCLERLERLADAEREYEEAATLRPESAGPLLGQAGVLIRRERYQEAVPLLERALRLRPNHARANLFLAIAEDGLGRTDEGTVHLRRALELAPGDAEVQAYQRARENRVPPR